MKRFSTFVLIATLGGLGPYVFKASADLEVSASVQISAKADFYAPLTPHGTWVEVGTYGRCWRPTGIAVEWRPYGYGTWVWTDRGWYWESDEPWGWATYHYGSWAYETGYGWVWVPGIEWAPAWVSWRFGGGYCGWAPLPPVGIVVEPRFFAFVEVAHFRDPVRPSKVIVNNTTIINNTTEINVTRRETRNVSGSGSQNVVVNEGPAVAEIEKVTGKKVQPVSIRQAASKKPVPAEAVRKINESRKEKEAPAAKQTPPDQKQDRKAVEPPAKGGRDSAPKPPPASQDKKIEKPADGGRDSAPKPPAAPSGGQRGRSSNPDEEKNEGRGRGGN